MAAKSVTEPHLRFSLGVRCDSVYYPLNKLNNHSVLYDLVLSTFKFVFSCWLNTVVRESCSYFRIT